LLIALGDVVKEAAADAVNGGDEEVVGAVENGAIEGESVEDEGSAEGLVWEMIKGDEMVLEGFKVLVVMMMVVVVCWIRVGAGNGGGRAWRAVRAG